MARYLKLRRALALHGRLIRAHVSRSAAPLVLVFMLGCAGPGPTPFPLVPLPASDTRSAETYYDTDGDGARDYGLRRGDDGTIAQLLYFEQGAAAEPVVVDLAAARSRARRHVLIILDSIPIDLMREVWQHGRFRLFAEPQAVIAPFPVMTDPALGDFFGVRPIPAVEARHAANGRLRGGLDDYVADTNSPWISYFDVKLASDQHAWSYLFPQAWLEYELGTIERALQSEPPPLLVTYVTSTSGIAMHRGRSGHVQALAWVDRLCHLLTQRYRGEIQITLMSDHGHAYGAHQRVRLGEALERAGYRNGGRLERRDAVIAPEFGLVSMATVHTHAPAEVARDLVGMTGIELTAFKADAETVVVLSKYGRARVELAEHGLRYVCEFGDPLALQPILAALQDAGAVRDTGVAEPAALFAATAEHIYPDPLERLWGIWDGMYAHPPDVVASLAPGWFSGDGLLLQFIDVRATHGNLRRASSTGFVLTTYGVLPRPLRMRDLAPALQALGMPPLTPNADE